MESIAYQSLDLLKAMESDSKIRLTQLRVDGGACVNNLLMQFQTDLIRVPLIRPQTIETTALGAAYLAGLSVGFWKTRKKFHSNGDQKGSFILLKLKMKWNLYILVGKTQ